MNQKYKDDYLEVIEEAKNLTFGPRDEDYNKSGVEPEDYFKPFGLKSYFQMVWLNMQK